jgi:predicted lipoprotein with Yx(FWY)xxD motif
MRNRAPAALILSLALAAACSSSSTPAATSTSSSSSATTTSTPAATTSSSSAASSATTVALATNATIGQQILVDGQGKTVYLFIPDGTSTTSKVPDAIKSTWPAVTAAGTASPGAGLDAAKLTTAAQADGTLQVLYNGHLLYNFAGDAAAGDAKGQGLGGNWYVLSASGDKVG